MNRREFMKNSTAAGAMIGLPAIIPSTSLGKDGAAAPSDRAAIGVIACGNRARYAGKYKQYARSEVVAVCDPIDWRRLHFKKSFGNCKDYVDFRDLLARKDVDAVHIATADHWHVPIALMAAKAGKDMYTEKPLGISIAHDLESRKIVDKYKRVFQYGAQQRSQVYSRMGIELVLNGHIGEVKEILVKCPKGHSGGSGQPVMPVPKGVDYDLWCGPAPKKPFNPNRFHYKWHWYWDYGNGEIGNNGPHVVDIAIQGLGRESVLPVKIASHGGRFAWNDQAETPNTQLTSYQYDDGTVLTLDVRNLASNKEAGIGKGVIFYGSKGYLIMRLNGHYETVIDGEPGPKGSGGGAHSELIANFYDVVRSRNPSDLLAPIEGGHIGAALCHLGNISYRLGRSLDFGPKTETFGNDAEANALLTREYRPPYVMPERI